MHMDADDKGVTVSDLFQMGDVGRSAAALHHEEQHTVEDEHCGHGVGQTQAAAGLHSGSSAGCHAVVRQDLGRGSVASGVDGRGLVRVSGGDSAREKQQAGKAQRCDLFSKHGILPSVRIGSAGVRLPAYTVSRRGIGSPDI